MKIYKINIWVIIFLGISQFTYCQITTKMEQIDNVLNIEARIKNKGYKKIIDSTMRFYFYEKLTRNIFRITTYKNKGDTTFNYLYARNYFRIDLSTKKKKFAIYYFENNKLVGQIENEMTSKDPYIFIEKGSTLKRFFQDH